MNDHGDLSKRTYYSRCTLGFLVILIPLGFLWCVWGYAIHLEKQFYLTCKIYNSEKKNHSIALESIREQLTAIVQHSEQKQGLYRVDENFIQDLMKSDKKIIFDNLYHYKSIMKKLILLKKDKMELQDMVKKGCNQERIGYQRFFVSFGSVEFYLLLIDVVNRHNDSLDCNKRKHDNCIILDASKKGQYPAIPRGRDFFALSLESWDFSEASYYIKNEDLAQVKKLYESYFNINKKFVTAENDFLYYKQQNTYCRNIFGLYISNYIGRYFKNPFEWY